MTEYALYSILYCTFNVHSKVLTTVTTGVSRHGTWIQMIMCGSIGEIKIGDHGACAIETNECGRARETFFETNECGRATNHIEEVTAS